MTNSSEAVLNTLVFELHRIRKERSDEVAKLIAAYDTETYRPALADIARRCEEHGHRFSSSYTLNPFGYSWRSCLICGARTDMTDPPTAEELEAVKPVGDYTVKLPTHKKKQEHEDDCV